MSTEYVVLRRESGVEVEITESSSLGDMTVQHPDGEYWSPVLRRLTADEIALMAVEMIKVASYLDPEAIQRTAQKLGEKSDWDYYQGVIRELL